MCKSEAKKRHDKKKGWQEVDHTKMGFIQSNWASKALKS